MNASPQAPVGKLPALATGVAVFAALALLAFGLVRIVPDARTPAPLVIAPATSAVTTAAVSPAATASRPTGPSVATAVKRPEAKPRVARRGNGHAAPRSAWDALTAKQQHALRPLADHWATMSPAQRQKWVVISRNFADMTIDEQAQLYSRMIEWASLTEQQRAEARFNFAETKQLTGEEKLAKWEAYQALSPEQREELAAKAPPRIHSAAPSLRPLPHPTIRPIRPERARPAPRREATAKAEEGRGAGTPAAISARASPAPAPAAAAAPQPVNPNTLLPAALRSVPAAPTPIEPASQH
ncbi:MAG: hypothetical protein OJF60_002376 [Burkholderiaceae bacterium]|jgi:hypothetical protein|nr:MAG: hypothetical protein OJF60_002376 [Burkholderiaceae bacterium]